MKLGKSLIVCVLSLVLLVMMASMAQAGYWQLRGTKGLKQQSLPYGPWVTKYEISGNSAVLYSYYTGQGLQAKLQFSWSGLPEKLFPGQTFTFTAEGREISRNYGWFDNYRLVIQPTGAAMEIVGGAGWRTSAFYIGGYTKEARGGY